MICDEAMVFRRSIHDTGPVGNEVQLTILASADPRYKYPAEDTR